MIYIILTIVIIYVIHRVINKNRNNESKSTIDHQKNHQLGSTVESITHLFLCLELEYFKKNPESVVDDNTLDYAFLVGAGHIRSKGSIEIKEIKFIATYSIQKHEKRANRLIYFIVMFIVAKELYGSETNNNISLKDNNTYLDSVNDFNGIEVQNSVNHYLKEASRLKDYPIEWVVVVKRFIQNHPNWFEMNY